MRISYKLLSEFIKFSPNESVEAIADRLTFSGAEVEEIIRAGEKLKNIVVAKIKTLKKHPRKDSWNIAELDVGGGKSAVCVTAATNLKDGDIVPYGAPGAVLADGTVLASREFDGVVSEGMVLSADELGVPEIGLEHGILRLEGDFKVGECAIKALGLDDIVLDVSVTPNRGDLQSVMGIARELKGLFPSSELLEPMAEYDGLGDKAFPYEFKSISLPDKGCIRYSLGAATNIKIVPSPVCARVLLALMGMRPISNMVDVTNLAMLVTGQPLHAFDLETLPAREITVRSAERGEKITTLDGKERLLTEQDMLITSGGAAIGIAGVMGGLNSEIRDTTTTVALEGASFEAMRVSHTARRLGIVSEAAYRYARGVDPTVAVCAMNYALGLMAKWGAAECGFVSLYAKNSLFVERKVKLTRPKLKKILLLDDMQEAKKILSGFSIEPVEEAPDGITFSVPSWRADISIEEDLIEEVGRFKGYNETEPRLPKNVRVGKVGAETMLARELRAVMLARGYAEALTYSFLPPDFTKEIHLGEDDARNRPLALANPISADLSCMRTTLLPGLLKALRNNLAGGWRGGLKIFEQGRVFLDEEHDHIAGVVFNGRDSREAWHDFEDFFSVKGDVASLGAFEFSPDEEPFGHAGQTAAILIEGNKIGYILRLKPSIEAEMEFGGAVYAFEFDVSALGKNNKKKFAGQKSFPAATRDISLLVPKDARHSDIVAAIYAHNKNESALIESVRLFDIYDGKGIPEGMRSLAFTLSYRAPDRTLQDNEVETANSSIRDMLSKKGYTLR